MCVSMIKRRAFAWVIILCTLCPLAGLANDIGYSVLLIPKDLLKNANSVKRTEQKEFILKKPGEAIFRHKYALTILNEAGDRYSNLVVYYDKFFQIRDISGTLYDASGKAIKKVKNKDIQDRSGVDDISLMDDNRVKVHDFYYRDYPYTVEYEVEIRYDGTMFYPEWFPQSREFLAVQQSSYTFTCPEDYIFRHKAYQFSGEPVVASNKGTKSHTWEVKNLKAVVREAYSPGLRQIAPLVLFGPTEFEMQQYKGNMATWQDLGKFIYALKQGRDVLPDNVKQQVRDLTAGVNDPYEKVKRLYEFLQANTRYISIQLGIGGWQPFDAKYVAEKKYGDCKALTNYMYALLKEAGIPSLYATIGAGAYREDIFTDFPSSQFNHVILCVPVARDTIWLECTDQFESTGYLGNFTGNRHALLVDENGGKLVKTPYYGADDNLQIRSIAAKLDETGSLMLDVHTRYTGTQHERVKSLIDRLSSDKVKEYLDEELSFPTYEVVDFKYRQHKKMIPEVEEELKIAVRNYASVTGKRLFILPNIMTRDGRKLSVDSVRKYPVNLLAAYTDIDTISIELPAGFRAESMPRPTEINSDFGSYYSEVKVEENKLKYIRKIVSKDGCFPAEKFKDLAEFQEAVYKADRSRVVLVKEADSGEGKKAF